MATQTPNILYLNYSPYQSYTINQYVYFNQTLRYRCIINTSKGESPITAPLKWEYLGTSSNKTIISVTGIDSIDTITDALGNVITKLVNDVATPTVSQYYGTDSGSTTRGWFDLPTANCCPIITTISTTDATLTEIVSVPIGLGEKVRIESECIAGWTGGSSGADGDTASIKSEILVRNLSGTLKILNEAIIYRWGSQKTATGLPVWNKIPTISGANCLINVQGADNNDIDWKHQYTTFSI